MITGKDDATGNTETETVSERLPLGPCALGIQHDIKQTCITTTPAKQQGREHAHATQCILQNLFFRMDPEMLMHGL